MINIVRVHFLKVFTLYGYKNDIFATLFNIVRVHIYVLSPFVIREINIVPVQAFGTMSTFQKKSGHFGITIKSPLEK